MDNYFEILGVNENSSDKEVKAKYRELVKKYHPDSNKDNEEYATEMTAKINAAYSALATEEGRKQYSFMLNSHGGLQGSRNLYPCHFVIVRQTSLGIISGEVYFNDAAVGILYELVTGINLQSFFARHQNGSTIYFEDFLEIYESPEAAENRLKSVGLILNPEAAENENLCRIYRYMRGQLANSARFYTPRQFDEITRHIQWCEQRFSDLIKEQTNNSILDLSGIRRAEYKTYEFSFDDITNIKHYTLKKFLIIAAVVAIIIFVIVFGFIIMAILAIAAAVLTLIWYIYSLFKSKF